MKIVGVHGVRNYRSALSPDRAAEQIAKIWTNALLSSPHIVEPVDLAVAYYAHDLRTSVAHGSETDPDLLNSDERAQLAQWVATLTGTEIAHGWLTLPARQLLGRLAKSKYSGRLSQQFLMVAVREIEMYLGAGNDARRHAVRTSVAAQLRSQRPDVVIAHSLGSVVAYETLCADPDLDVDLLVTLGSPLALPGIVDRLDPKPNPHTAAPRPPGVRQWVNIADPGDLCAVPRWLGKRFAVDSHCEVPIGTFAFHQVTKYLACPQMATTLSARQRRPS